MLDPRARRRFRKNRGALLGAALIAFVMTTALLGPWFAPYAPAEQFADGLNALGDPRLPDAHYLLGTDLLGRDELSRLLHGGLVSMQVALCSTTIALALGLAVGVTAGYFGGLWDSLSMRVVDMLLALPFLLIAIAVHRAIAHPTLWSLNVLLGCLSWPVLARVARAKSMAVRKLEYVEAARALGTKHITIVWRHVLPNVLGPVIVIGTTMIADMIIVESAMSFLGLGVQPPTASWGSMLYEGRDVIAHAPRLLIFPGLLIVTSVFGFNLAGEGLRDALDPKA